MRGFLYLKGIFRILYVMPELPEVETVRLQLMRKVIGKTIDSITVYHQKTIDHNQKFTRELTGKTIDHIDRIGKLLIFSFVGETNRFLLAHLKMTGQFFYVAKAGDVTGGGHSMTPNDMILPHKHTRVAYHFTDSSTLYFNDMRLFGYTKIATAAEVEKARSGFGPEPIDPEFDITWFTEKLRRRTTVVKAALLDQSFIAGLGNIYVDETLWRAKVQPTRRANEVTKAEARAIATAAGEVMNEAIKVGGTTFQHFADTEGDAGNFTEYLKVFGKQATPCPRCGTLIVKIRYAGRGTHYCPGCQT